ncbi:MAG: M1 family metallopeptidase [Puia sp.]|nr:M1 family metallopeptidase [Puia sp.]
MTVLQRISAYLFYLLFFCSASAYSQPARDWWDLLHYDIEIRPNYDKQTVSGSNSIRFLVLNPGQEMQIDLQQPMTLTAVSWLGTSLPFRRTGNAWFIRFPRLLPKGDRETVELRFGGNPRTAVHPPYDNGWIWTKDRQDRPWVSVTCEGSGASIWLPCKDVLRDEPDSGVSMAITIPDSLTAVSNGRLKTRTANKDSTTTWRWAVVNPINNYDIIPYIGKYVSWHETYTGEKGRLDCDYWVLDYDLAKARDQFRQADSMLHCFEYWMGPYPFYEDSYKLVEAPHPGMEHQSAIAYGNGFMDGFGGKDLSGTGWGLKWDFILVHESAHEWFGNSITAKGDGDSWIHEGFAKYLETIYTTCVSGTEAGNDYAIGIRKRIRNDESIITGNTQDKYNKGSAMLHMIRQILGDEGFRTMLRALNKRFYHQTVSTGQLTDYCSKITGRDLSRIFDQYLRTTQIPLLEYSIQGDMLRYRWANCVKGFNMPVKVTQEGQSPVLLNPIDRWQRLPSRKWTGKSLSVDRNYYVGLKSIKA